MAEFAVKLLWGALLSFVIYSFLSGIFQILMLIVAVLALLAAIALGAFSFSLSTKEMAMNDEIREARNERIRSQQEELRRQKGDEE